jgi:TPR repeat protein
MVRKGRRAGTRWGSVQPRDLYIRGWGPLGLRRNLATGAKWSKKAAEQGEHWAQTRLGILYRYGGGVPEDFAEAVKWFRKAAEQGNAQAQFHLGTMCYHGQGVLQDFAEAVKWYRMAAEQEYAEAQSALGMLYSAGTGVPQECALAYMWLNLAASKLSGTDRESAVKGRDLAAGKLTPEQLMRAQQMARDWKPTTAEAN